MKEYKEKTLENINNIIKEKQEALRVFRFGSTGSKIKNVKLGKSIRKEIARAMTEISIRKNAI
ncbi:MAG TPA: 50S ribosomal protein L29 [Candidatus Paceibacterota bacterium]